MTEKTDSTYKKRAKTTDSKAAENRRIERAVLIVGLARQICKSTNDIGGSIKELEWAVENCDEESNWEPLSNISDVYSDGALRDLLATTISDGCTLRLEQIAVLAGLDDPEGRSDLLRATVEQSLSPKQMLSSLPASSGEHEYIDDGEIEYWLDGWASILPTVSHVKHVDSLMAPIHKALDKIDRLCKRQK